MRDYRELNQQANEGKEGLGQFYPKANRTGRIFLTKQFQIRREKYEYESK
ncbi:MAG: hypothetical protein LWX55_01495 [Deltaproteobacteria bacterium]|jgi:hypothetical protein|nr:hypothetical protein [Deltaproteobacteria bacterium]